MKKFFTLLMLSLLTVVAFANKQISGVVVDEKGDAVIGASVMVMGTTTGVITDIEGAFTLSVADDAKTLVVSYVGLLTQNVAIRPNMRIVMHENAELLDDVVVTGYASVSKGQFAGSATAINAEEIEKKSPTEITKSMAGEVAGLQVVNSTGQPGSNAGLRLRGIGSVYASTNPLIIVDGVTYEGDLSSIDPGDIASYNVLKDATATSLYGTRGANGVIVIMTKRGSSGEEGKIDVDMKYGANMHLLPMYDVITSPEEYVEMAWQGIYNSLRGSYQKEERLVTAVNNTLFDGKQGLSPMYNLWDVAGNQLIDGYTGKFYPDVNRKAHYQSMDSWKKAIFRVGQKFDGTVRISGGTEKTTYYTSLGYLKDEGYYIGSDFDRFTLRSNVTHEAKKWLKGSMNVAYTYSTMNSPGQGSNMNNGFAFVNEIPAIYPVFLYNPDGTIMNDPKTGANAYDYGMSEGTGRGYASGINPAGSLRYDRDKTVQHQVVANGSLEFKLYTGLKLTVNAGLQYLGATNYDYTNSFYGDAAGIGRLSQTNYSILGFTFNQLLNYNTLVNEHSIDVMVGHEINYYSQSVSAFSKSHVGQVWGDAVLELGNFVQNNGSGSSTDVTALDSYFLNANYIYDEKYGVTVNYRADCSSKFARGHRWGHFGSVGAMWNFTKESFLQDYNDIIDNGKLRVSWGVLGNQGISSYLYSDRYALDYSDGGEIAITWSGPSAHNITWEKTSQVDVGVEFDLSKYLTAEFDYFYKYTYDMLMPRYVAPSLGYSAVWINGGSMRNQGVEFQLNVHAVNENNVKLNIRLNGGHYKNKVLTLPKDINTENEDMIYNGGLAPGHSLYDYNMVTYAGVDPETGEALYKGYYDANRGAFGGARAEDMEEGEKGNNHISNLYVYKEKHPNAVIRDTVTTTYPYAGSNYIGKSAEPALDGGFGFDLEAYGVTLDVTCSYRLGGYGYDSQYASLMHSDKAGRMNWHVDMRNAWTTTNTETDIPRLSNGTDSYANYGSTRFLVSNSYLSLNNIRLGYNFPKKLLGKKNKFHLNNLNVYVSADNLAILSARKGYNPMTSYAGSSDSYQYTPLSTIMGGIKFQF